LRNSTITILHSLLQYKDANLVVGFGIAYKYQRRILNSGTPNFILKEKVNSDCVIEYLKKTSKPLTPEGRSNHGQ